jgi:phosphoglycolate phosphatase-like HAD superfamily hydrolase
VLDLTIVRPLFAALQGKLKHVQYVIFDIDGTLTQSTGFDASCFRNAVLEHADVEFKGDWGEYRHVTDSGILSEIIESHGLSKFESEITKEVKASFISNIDNHLKVHPVAEVPGANRFLKELSELNNVTVAIATGGWGETAELKLKSAGISFEQFPLCSANDAESRVDIMKLARLRAGMAQELSISYFGDATWDKKACAELGWNFILVGNRTDHHQNIRDFTHYEEALRLCTL